MSNQFLYREKESGVEILRCYGNFDSISIPEIIAGKPVTEVGAYLFSADMRGEPQGTLWIETENNGFSVDNRELPQVFCGDSVREITLPQTVKKLGKYAFYNCDKLRSLSLTSTITDIGAGAFNGCRKITDLDIRLIEEEKSCLKEILAELNETLTVHYHQIERAADGGQRETGRAELLFPVFYEEAVENTPARILETHIHGCGHRYRYCFQGTRFQFSEYDSLFIHAKVQENPEHVAALSFDRLRYPLNLSGEAKALYEIYLMGNMEATALLLMKRNDMEALKWLLSYFAPADLRTEFEHVSACCLGNEGLAVRAREEFNNIKKPVLGETGFDKLIEISNRFGRTEALSLIMDARYQALPLKKKKFKL